ncbi:hypothetical protein BC938DRAFT_470662 [Jimgerdemannia flammicorona]|uniref:Uncharacterized protein n=1 Tax=Jimgerdemannia flammicorona TaxID=994334 RepID=A0A433Q9P6_9FUNG|nr:hypothetical protein BC938DRAFT_470662 [Jimgerdemannia flammicorona]
MSERLLAFIINKISFGMTVGSFVMNRSASRGKESPLHEKQALPTTRLWYKMRKKVKTMIRGAVSAHGSKAKAVGRDVPSAKSVEPQD